MDNKKIADYALAFIGGTPEVFEYHNDDKKKTIDVLFCDNKNKPENFTVATIGLSAIDIGKTLNDLPLRVELIMAGVPGDDAFANIIASAAFVVQDAADCDLGMIIDDVVAAYVIDTDLQHVLLMNPVFWEKYEPLVTKEATVTWLLAIPISDIEKQYIIANGFDDFAKILDEENVNITDLHRKSCI